MKRAVTAQNLRTGAVVYRAADGSWTDRLMEAARYDPGSAELESSLQAARDAEVVNAYVIDLAEGAQNAPAGRGRLREWIRASGPSFDCGRKASSPSRPAAATVRG
ncbi:MAG: hypothetical protein Tsb0010_15240 [Parvularculaceae bacterium]